jgi:hypothetical protein
MSHPVPTPSGPPPTSPASTLPRVLALYALARLGLLTAIAGVLVLAGVPVLIALMVGLVVALPLSMLVFRGMRARLDTALAEAQRRRSAERAALRARLRGDDERGARSGGSDDRAEGESEPGRG